MKKCYKISGWFEVDGEMYDKLLTLLESNGDVSEGWLFQKRKNKDYGSYSFVHFGNFVSLEEQTSLLEFIIDCAKIKSNYSDCPDEIRGEFLVAELNNQVPSVRISIGNSTYDVIELQ